MGYKLLKAYLFPVLGSKYVPRYGVSLDHSHKDQKDYKCDLCDNSFSTAGDMMSHTVSVHENHND